MTNIQIPTKLRRNAPCHCGSGRKYKKCHGKKEGETKMTEEQMIKDSQKILKNEFRDEVRDPYAGIPKAELVTRDQAVLMRELRFRVNNGNEDVNHISKAIEKAKALRVELYSLPKSPYREELINDLAQYIKTSEEKLRNLGPQKSMVLNLMALEELFEVDKVKELAKPFGPMISPKVPEAEPEDALDEDDLTIPEEQPGEGVDEDANPNEVI